MRLADGRSNAATITTSRTMREILRSNIVTRFNAILGTLLLVIVVIGRWQDGLFGLVLVANALIGVVQETRAKRQLDRLAILHAPRAHVRREGITRDVAIDDVVQDDLVLIAAGDQVVADGEVVTSTSLHVDESLLSGESEPVEKVVGDRVLSGSYVASGSGLFRATDVGERSYARRLTSESRGFALVHSEILAGVNRLLRYITWAIPPVALLLLRQRYPSSSWRDVATGVVAGLVGMVPQGLVLLTSIAFGAAALALSRRHVLLQQMPAVEALARVDVVCFDKTGTLTDGTVAFDRLEVVDGDIADLRGALAEMLGTDAATPTMVALREGLRLEPRTTARVIVPFASERKWSGVTVDGSGSWILGAPEIVLGSESNLAAREHAARLAGSGARVIALARSAEPLVATELPNDVRAAALVVLTERVRPDARATIDYFLQEGVRCWIISGDHPATVGEIARRAGVPGAEAPRDARTLVDDDAVRLALESTTVFGRVTPHQKRVMVEALQDRGHTVAMTGDGVNDVPALKRADVAIALGSATPATRAVAEIILLDNRFASLPVAVAEGRRVAANIERVANTFLTKTVWATALAVIVGVAAWPFPLLPRHLTIIDSLTIGIPSFFLALAPNARRYAPGFVGRVLRFAVPGGLVVAAGLLVSYAVTRGRGAPRTEQSSEALLVALGLGLVILALTAFPLTWRRWVLLAAVAAGGTLPFAWAEGRRFLELSSPSWRVAIESSVIVLGGAVLLITVWNGARHASQRVRP